MKRFPFPFTSAALLLAAAASVGGCKLLAPLPPGPTIFQRMDADHDGKVTRAEFDAGFADAMLTVYDLESDGSLTQTQWNGVERPGRAGGSFAKLDANHDGKLTRAEMSSGKGRDAAVNKIFDRIDKNHDGSLSPQEAHASQLDLTPQERAQRVRPQG